MARYRERIEQVASEEDAERRILNAPCLRGSCEPDEAEWSGLPCKRHGEWLFELVERLVRREQRRREPIWSGR